MFCPPSPPASTGLQPPPSHSLLLLSPPSTIVMSVKCHVVFKVSKDVEKFKAKALELVKISKVKNNCQRENWQYRINYISVCNPFHSMIEFVKTDKMLDGKSTNSSACLLARLTSLNLNSRRHIRHSSRCSVASV